MAKSIKHNENVVSNSTISAGGNVHVGNKINVQIQVNRQLGKKNAMISSATRDLLPHLKQVEDACHRMGVSLVDLPRNFTLENDITVQVSLNLMDEVDLFIGIFAHQYGFVPESNNPDSISIVEIEYNRAVDLGIPRLIFFMHDDHDLKGSDVETCLGAEKLGHLKKRISNVDEVMFFKNPEDLRRQVIHTISQMKKRWEEGQSEIPYQFHYIHPMVLPPEPYIAHPYTLSQTTGLIGRHEELKLLTDWIKKENSLSDVRIFNIIAIGGMGKSALSWEWFSKIAPLEWKEMAGRFWWSFYESDAYFENFIIRALAYVSQSSPEEVRKKSASERETALLQILDREAHLIVLDGLERILITYARIDATHLADDDYDQQTANYTAQSKGFTDTERENFLDKHRLRKTSDPRAGQFLKKLSHVRTSRILISSRLYPFDLQMITGEPLPGCYAVFLNGLCDDDALALWRQLGASGENDDLLRLFHCFDSHPLLLQSLAGEIAQWRPSPGNFKDWCLSNPGFDPFSLPLIQIKNHILFFALKGLSQTELHSLRMISALRMPVYYETIFNLLDQNRRGFWEKLFPKKNKNENGQEVDLDLVLQNLENRGLVGWDRRSNRYDLHPVVRGVLWNSLSRSDERNIYLGIKRYFESKVNELDIDNVRVIEDLTSPIELFYALTRLHMQKPAYDIFMIFLDDLILYRIGSYRIGIEMLEIIWANPKDVVRQTHGWYTRFVGIERVMFNTMALLYLYAGEPQKSVEIYEKNLPIEINNSNAIKVYDDLFAAQVNYSECLLRVGKLKLAHDTLDSVLNHPKIEKDSHEYRICQLFWGEVFSLMGNHEISERIYLQNLKQIDDDNDPSLKRLVFAANSSNHLRRLNPIDANLFVKKAWSLVHNYGNDRHTSSISRLQGQVTLALGDYTVAHEYLHDALVLARKINFVEEEIRALISLSEIACKQKTPKDARAYLNDAWEYIERGPYPLFNADAHNVLCQIERDEGNIPGAIEAAKQAFRLAWCDGPPYNYHYGLENARRHLKELGIPEPQMI